MYKLIDGRDKSFEIVGDTEIIKYLGYPSDIDMFDASERLECENDGMNLYHIIHVD